MVVGNLFLPILLEGGLLLTRYCISMSISLSKRTYCGSKTLSDLHSSSPSLKALWKHTVATAQTNLRSTAGASQTRRRAFNSARISCVTGCRDFVFAALRSAACKFFLPLIIRFMRSVLTCGAGKPFAMCAHLIPAR